ncbi:MULTISPECIES: WhiB family transcriptional regulator [unclassified Streptomyces]|uniref:WhiB family transcriptional regulator n=1 Tax=unclassified Streptomyces TaxID=2593676 RepID=UPI00081DE664|nr:MULTISPECIES: WhiB family transcriptional regulator [unclassified Streptomyces]MYR27803.1 WhiB family transcriptional regulator [Streptomyces sp. SID4945]SCF29556.1 WhiB family transcriptional regulator, redox-sensing transcriptional regulator [Streptomyces sp. LcepLS]
MSTAWMSRARCAEPGVDGELFFPRTEANMRQVAEAREMCLSCPVLALCREWALAQMPSLDGIWGGLTHTERIRRRRQEARTAAQAGPGAGVAA